MHGVLRLPRPKIAHFRFLHGAIALLLLVFAFFAAKADAAPRTRSANNPPAAASAAPAAAPAPEPQKTKLVVGTKPSPPFAIKNADGSWSGIAIELWRMLASDLGMTFEIREYDLKGLLTAVEKKEIDAAVGAITITSQREKVMDFSHPIYSTGLSIAVAPQKNKGGAMAAMKGLMSWELAKIIGVLFGLLVVIGTLVWLFERRKNDAQFGGGPVKGIGAGVWWSAVTMTTVGYGDKSPVTTGGRVLGLFWMFAAVILTSSFTATITSTLTVDRLESSIKGPDDLKHVRVATVAGSTSATYLEKRHIVYKAVPTVLDGMKAVQAGQVDAMVYDAPLLQYIAKNDLGGQVQVLPITFEHQDYGIALPDGSPMRENLNRALLDNLGKDTWNELVNRYLAP
jgi:polar amino acid transport system substrate-binding protein